MFEYTLTKRFAAACLVLVLALPCLSAFADEALPPEETPPAASSEPAETPLPEETPPPSAEPGSSESPAPAETPPPPSETPAPVETPPPSETPAPTEIPPPASTETPPPTPTPAPPESAQPEYTVDSALSYLAENGILLSASPAPDTATAASETAHEMHRLYLGKTGTGDVLTVDMSQLLPDLYHRLTVNNFCAVPASSAMVSASGVSIASSGSFTYDSSTGILTCPYLYRKETTKGNACFFLFNIYCYYNDSVPAANAEVPTVTTRSYLDTVNLGKDIELPNFPGLHMRYLKSAASTATVDGYLNETLPDLYTFLSSDNFGVSPYSTLWAKTSVSIHNPPIPYNITTGHYYVYPCTGTENPLMSATNKEFLAYNYDLLLYYNVESEMVFEDPSPTPAPSDTPTAPVAAPHPFWTTPFEEYSVTEGMLLLILSLLALFAVVKVFRR